ncbi:MAG: phage holin family protein [Bacteroidota bacterium]
MTITLDLIIEFLLLGVAVAVVAYLLPFIYIRNFGTAVLVGVLVSVFNAGILWILNQAGISLNTGALTLAHLVLTTVSILVVDKILTGFRVKQMWGAAVFGILVILINLGLNQLLSNIF